MQNNPNTLEILGCKEEQYLYISKIGKELLEGFIAEDVTVETEVVESIQ